MFIAIVSVEGNRIAKYAAFDADREDKIVTQEYQPPELDEAGEIITPEVPEEFEMVTRSPEYQADEHVTAHGGFVFEHTTGEPISDLWIDGQSVTISAPPPNPDAIRQEVSDRIYAHASAATQMNMAAAAAAGLLNADQMAAFQAGLAWVAAMRAKGAELAAAGAVDFADDSHWPEPSPEAVALAAAF
ncbi:MAG: hypothetical protein KDJ69_12070 [Nitratireductor sp.]|nr:hypothetical protein [Nitratireductor sp.]